MTWVRIDDGFHDHPKIRGIIRDSGFAPVGFLLCMMSWSARHLTDGTIPEEVVCELAGHRNRVTPLVTPLDTAGVARWVSRKRHGVTVREIRIHDWADYQETAKDVKARRAADRERQRRYREALRNGVTPPELPPGVTTPRPSPSRSTPQTPRASHSNGKPKREPDAPGRIPDFTDEDRRRNASIADELEAARAARAAGQA